ncbi:MAG: alpha/beta fold hydrolase [Anaerolineales bacterium]|jgi:predicted peptidase
MPEFTSGIHLEKGAKQRYTIHIPHQHTLGEAVPLVVLLHWGGKRYRYIGRDMLEQFGLPALNRLQAILVAPDSKRRHWATRKSADDISSLIAYLEEHYNVDSAKKVVVGFSVGGVGVWYLAAQRPDLFSCGVAVASTVPEHILEDEWNFPMYIVHSELDDLFPFEIVQQRAAQLQQENAPIRFEKVEFAAHTDIRDYIPAVSRVISWIQQNWES